MTRALPTCVAFAACALALGGAPAVAETAADEAIATASAQPAPTSDAAQIQQWIAAAPPPALDEGLVDGVVENGPRKVHGEVGVAVGTGGYRSAYAVSAFPVGQTGTLTVAVGESRFGRFGPGGAARSLALGYSSSEAAGGPADRCRRRYGASMDWAPSPETGFGDHGECFRSRYGIRNVDVTN